MPVKELAEVPENLRDLLPEKAREEIVVGDKAYALYPMTGGMCEEVVDEVSAVLNELFGARDKALSDFDILSKDGRILKLLAKSLDMDLADIRKNITTAQILHAAGVIFNQNFSLDRLPKQSRKHIEMMWNKFFGPKIQPVDLSTVVQLIESDQRNAIPKVDLLRLLDSYQSSLPSGGTKSSPQNTAGATSTSEEPIVANVNSSTEDVTTGASGTSFSGPRMVKMSSAQIIEAKKKSLSS